MALRLEALGFFRARFMRQAHRSAHRLIWLAVTVLAALGIACALVLRPANATDRMSRQASRTSTSTPATRQ
jgi:hypothetical protein